MTELEVFKQSLDVSRLTLILSLVVSTASIVFASLEMAFQRSHNKRSILPLCELSERAEGESVSITLRNVGLGPLILSAAVLSGEPDAEAELLAAPSAGLVIPPMEKATILSYPRRSRPILAERELRVEYRDIYDREHRWAEPLGSIAPLQVSGE